MIYFYYVLTLCVSLSVLLLFYYISYYRVALVEGDSMYPTLKNNSVVIFKCKKFSLEEGGMYLFQSPLSNELYVKRLSCIARSSITGEQVLYFIGDNEEDSLDSRSFGFISIDRVKGKVVIY